MAKYYNKKELVQALRNRAEELGHAPAPSDMTELSAKAVLVYFKKWSKALKAAGLQNKVQTTSEKKAAASEKDNPSHVEFIEAEDLAEKKTTTDELVKASIWENAEKTGAADQSADVPCTRRYSRSIITRMLLNECNRLGKKPTRKEIDENKDLPTVGTILKYFDTTQIGDVWSEVLK